MEPVTILTIWIIVALIIIGVYTYVWSSSLQPHQQGKSPHISRWRKPLFIIMIVVLGSLLAYSVPRVPYAGGEIPDVVVYVTGRQFGFVQSEHSISNEEEFANAAGYQPQISVGQLVEFRVTSLDVNHGLGIYGPDGRFLGQTQAMPMYLNRLFMKFTEPGVHTIRCLEYCGLAHHAMQLSFEVQPSNNQVGSLSSRRVQ